MPLLLNHPPAEAAVGNTNTNIVQNNNYSSHTASDESNADMGIKRRGGRRLGVENIVACGQSTVHDSMKTRINSRGHQNSINLKCKETGIKGRGYYPTQIFGQGSGRSLQDNDNKKVNKPKHKEMIIAKAADITTLVHLVQPGGIYDKNLKPRKNQSLAETIANGHELPEPVTSAASK
eukprot:CAMPEP_0113302816 /NCGR_PEP_ID=MMETSP0010_2-20120614/3488_1 /TAXON_ID=216773 ORGANISM="Corethron hystrix, Strain 308" /NCGR_SAMPLE_ID=MMETSP0010_2 /ASSEMBLY_ACC=CAM_ASM_000155 /LENGTH=177 /DNA_ID=CAMNT_0000156703 /DNA_START=74 /DNA_END=608 /DNA_ORIENTATION=- /assembly_acc=CAM_ASM_000155